MPRPVKRKKGYGPHSPTFPFSTKQLTGIEPDTKDERAAKDRLIEQFMKTKGVLRIESDGGVLKCRRVKK